MVVPLLIVLTFTFIGVVGSFTIPFLIGPNAKVIAPSIVNAFATSGTELTAAMALIQTFTVVVALVILFRLTRGIAKELT